MGESARELLAALVSDEWAGWGYEDISNVYRCFYCTAEVSAEDDQPYSHNADCPIVRARELLKAMPDAPRSPETH